MPKAFVFNGFRLFYMKRHEKTLSLYEIIYIERLFAPHWGWIGVVPRAAFEMPLHIEVVFQKPM